MTLGYKQTFPDGTPTLFKEKILKAACENLVHPIEVKTDHDLRRQLMSLYDKLPPKLHSIREDLKNNWPPSTGMIHHCYDSRSPKRNCFLKSPCISIQRILITNDEKRQDIMVDGRMMDTSTMEKIACNDGFNSLEHFFTWFNRTYAGKIIHFTKLRY